MVNVTRSSMPDYIEYCDAIKELWGNRWLTNYGRNLELLEKEMKMYLGLNSELVVVQNGTLALMVALNSLDFEKGSEIITTPFTFIATTSSIVWQNLNPIFVDIDPDTFNIDVKKIEENISSKTKGILAVHTFGNPCNVIELDKIANKNDLKLIYDSAHCFGVNCKGKSILEYGDISTLSLHATKVFHTIEGGAIYTNHHELRDKIRKVINFGHNQKHMIDEVGINSKMNEFQAIMGLLNLKYVSENIKKRENIYNLYKENLKDLDVQFQTLNSSINNYNYCYFPILFNSFEERELVYINLVKNKIYPKKYFYPIINNIEVYKKYRKQDTPIAQKVSERILILPLYPELKKENVFKIIKIIKNSLLK